MSASVCIQLKGRIYLEVDNEHECVMVLDFLHSGLGYKGVHNRTVLVHSRRMINGFPLVTGLHTTPHITRQLLGLCMSGLTLRGKRRVLGR
jgi:hypothetical protein